MKKIKNKLQDEKVIQELIEVIEKTNGDIITVGLVAQECITSLDIRIFDSVEKLSKLESMYGKIARELSIAFSTSAMIALLKRKDLTNTEHGFASINLINYYTNYYDGIAERMEKFRKKIEDYVTESPHSKYDMTALMRGDYMDGYVLSFQKSTNMKLTTYQYIYTYIDILSRIHVEENDPYSIWYIILDLIGCYINISIVQVRSLIKALVSQHCPEIKYKEEITVQTLREDIKQVDEILTKYGDMKLDKIKILKEGESK